MFDFHRYFRFTIDEDDVSDAAVSRLGRTLANPGRFIRQLETLGKDGKLSLALTKLLAREDLAQCPDRVGMIAALCAFGDRGADLHDTQPRHHLPIESALISLIERHTDPNAASADRLALLQIAIQEAGVVHFANRLAEHEDRKEHYASNPQLAVPSKPPPSRTSPARCRGEEQKAEISNRVDALRCSAIR